MLLYGDTLPPNNISHFNILYNCVQIHQNSSSLGVKVMLYADIIYLVILLLLEFYAPIIGRNYLEAVINIDKYIKILMVVLTWQVFVMILTLTKI